MTCRNACCHAEAPSATHPLGSMLGATRSGIGVVDKERRNRIYLGGIAVGPSGDFADGIRNWGMVGNSVLVCKPSAWRRHSKDNLGLTNGHNLPLIVYFLKHTPHSCVSPSHRKMPLHAWMRNAHRHKLSSLPLSRPFAKASKEQQTRALACLGASPLHECEQIDIT